MAFDAGMLLRDSRAYLSGPMDFVASRKEEKESGWRTRVGQFLRALGVTVFDPWNKPDVRGLHEYGAEGEATTDARAGWTYEQTRAGAQTRSDIASAFWPALHIDLRMVDTSDFVICYCPTNIYSVGTVHEIVLARQQRKPVLFVSPYVKFDALARLQAHLAQQQDQQGQALLADLVREAPIKENLNASPSLWYMPLIGGAHFFDGFGFEAYRGDFGWNGTTPLDRNEGASKIANPLLPFLLRASREVPKRWDRHARDFVTNDDWLIWDLKKDAKTAGAKVSDARQEGAEGDPKQRDPA